MTINYKVHSHNTRPALGDYAPCGMNTLHTLPNNKGQAMCDVQRLKDEASAVYYAAYAYSLEKRGFICFFVK